MYFYKNLLKIVAIPIKRINKTPENRIKYCVLKKTGYLFINSINSLSLREK